MLRFKNGWTKKREKNGEINHSSFAKSFSSFSFFSSSSSPVQRCFSFKSFTASLNVRYILWYFEFILQVEKIWRMKKIAIIIIEKKKWARNSWHLERKKLCKKKMSREWRKKINKNILWSTIMMCNLYVTIHKNFMKQEFGWKINMSQLNCH